LSFDEFQLVLRVKHPHDIDKVGNVMMWDASDENPRFGFINNSRNERESLTQKQPSKLHSAF
jgi:hypothetical protein